MAARNPWLSLSLDMMRLGMEAQTVVALRMMKLGAGGAASATEAELMVSEKIKAAVETHTQLMTSALSGKAHLAPARAVAHYRRQVRANARRLMK